MAEMLSNVIGAPFSEYVLKQLSLRAYHNSTNNRTSEEVLFLANKSAWIRLTSSVRLEEKPVLESLGGVGAYLQSIGFTKVNSNFLQKFYESVGLDITIYNTPDSLRKNWILEAGTSISKGQGVDLRKGIGLNGAYGLGGIEELGYRPMPGLTSVTIETLGILGSLRQATINFKVWNMNQLSIIETLYFRLGFSMVLEWGHTQYFSNEGANGLGTFTNNNFGLDLFTSSLRKETIQQKMAKRTYETSGNYQGMLGIVTNFTWAMNQEGGYDCTVKIIGLGSIIDSLRINPGYNLPSSLKKIYDAQQAKLQRQKAEQEERERIDQEKRALQQATQARIDAGLTQTPLAPIKSIDEIYTVLYKTDAGTTFDGSSNQKATVLADATYFSSDYLASPDATLTIPDYYYKAVKGGDKGNVQQKSEIDDVGGLFITSKAGNQTPPPINFQIPGNIEPGWPQPVYFDTNLLELRFDQYNSLGNALTNKIKELDENQYVYSSLKYILKQAYKVRAAQTGGTVSTPLQASNPLVDSLLTKSIPLSLPLSSNTYGDTFNGALSNTLLERIKKVGNQQQFSITITYPSKILNSNGVVIEKDFFFALKYTPNGQPYSSEDLTSFFALWQESRGNGAVPLLNLTNIQTSKAQGESNIGVQEYNELVVEGSLNFVNKTPGDVNERYTQFPAFQIITNDTRYFVGLATRSPRPGTPPPITSFPVSGDTSGNVNESDASQTKTGDQFASALNAMLTVVKAQIETEGYSVSNRILPVDLLQTTQIFYSEGILKEVLTKKTQGNKAVIDITQPDTQVQGFDLLQYALKGFNSNLMLNGDTFAETPSVNFKNLCVGYSIPYTMKDPSNRIYFPTYIKFGYLLAFLNNMCLIYDSTVDTDKHPYVYLDFNPDTNLCLSSPQHLSVDPTVCMIPFTGFNESYYQLFPFSDTEDGLKEVQKIAGKLREEDIISGAIGGFKNTDNQYQGKTMEILLNIDFLLRVAKENTNADKEHVLNLKGFLDRIVSEVNKATGNLNLFRVAYRDDSNTVIIKDDQFVPPLASERSDMSRNNTEPTQYGVIYGPQVPRYGQLPVFGLTSLVRDMQFQTNLSTNISNQIAISAQANTGSVNSTDHSSFSYLNRSFEDAYKPLITDVAKVKITPTQEQQKQKEAIVINNKEQAETFNQHVLSIYKNFSTFSQNRVDMAINYYINGIAKTKSETEITSAAQFIPANLSITIDGIGGIVMGQAFTIPENRLPLSLRGDGKYTKVGFIVVGLTHTVENNQWLTTIRGQMIKLRDVNVKSPIPVLQTGVSKSSVGKDNPCAFKYSGAGPDYSCANQETFAVDAAAFKRLYPNYTFTKGVSDINLAAKGLKPLAANEIIDDTSKNRFNITNNGPATLPSPVPFFVIHHTAGGGSADDVYSIFYSTGLPAQYVIDRQGGIHRFIPDGMLAWHAGAYNGKSIGVEVIALNDQDVLPVQVEAAARLAQYLGFKRNQLIGHGQITSAKLPDEGKTIVNYVKTLI